MVKEWSESDFRKVVISAGMYLDIAGYDGGNHTALFKNPDPNYGDDKTGISPAEYGFDLMMVADDRAFETMIRNQVSNSYPTSLAGALVMASAHQDGTYKGSFDLAAASMKWLLSKVPDFWSDHDEKSRYPEFNFTMWFREVIAPVVY